MNAATIEYTPPDLTALPRGCVFVFDTNADGIHTSHSARVAVDHFGAIMGRGEGMKGQSYAIPTTGSVRSMHVAIDRFLAYARRLPHMRFYVAEFGGYPAVEIAHMFAGAPSNVVLPKRLASAVREVEDAG